MQFLIIEMNPRIISTFSGERYVHIFVTGNCLVQILEVVKRRPIRAIVLTSRGVGIPLQSPNPRFSLFSLYQPLKAPEVRGCIVMRNLTHAKALAGRKVATCVNY